MKAEALKSKWHKDLIRDDLREADMDEQRLGKMPLHLFLALNRLKEKDERRYYRIQYETHSICDLNDKVCLEDTGNSFFDKSCGNNTTREEKENANN